MSNKLFRELAIVAVSLAVGAVCNLVAFFAVAFLFAGSESDAWVEWYFGFGDGVLIVAVTVSISVIAFLTIRKRGLKVV